ncbi:hypothetical protein EDC94DRAFT_684883, partial [Helicostylum pulchrum]
LQYISTNNKICLVVLDYAGLTTDPSDLKIFIETNKNIEMIIVDNLPQNNKIEIFERKKILKNPSILDAFKCRTSIKQRSNKHHDKILILFSIIASFSIIVGYWWHLGLALMALREHKIGIHRSSK